MKINKFFNYMKGCIKNKKEKNFVVDFHKSTLELRKADKYYISFRILNRWSFYFQGLNCLLFSLETFFKLLYILDKTEYTNTELKKLGHNLRRTFKKIKLNKKKFDLVFRIVSNYGYNEIRYNAPDLINELNSIDHKRKFVYLDKLDYEIKELHKIITHKIRKRFNAPGYQCGLNIYKYHSLDPIEKKKMIDDALSKGDIHFSLDQC